MATATARPRTRLDAGDKRRLLGFGGAVFLINVPVAAVVLMITSRHVPESRDAMATGRLDLPGAALVTVGLAGVTYGAIAAGTASWSAPGVLTALAVGGVGLLGFLLRETVTSGPMLPLRMFADRQFTGANAVTFVVYAALGGALFLLPVELQQVAGYSALKSGVTGLVPTVVMFLFSARMGRLADRYGARLFMTFGPLLVASGFFLMLRYGTSVSLFGDVLPALLVLSFGLALTVAPLTATVLADANEADAGIASAVNNAIARTAALIAVAAVGAVVSAHYGSLLDQRLGKRLPTSSQAAVREAKRRTFGTIAVSAVPPADRMFAANASATASRAATSRSRSAS